MDKWKVITSVDEIRPKSKFQEKTVVVARNTVELERLKNIVITNGAELCDVPASFKNIQETVVSFAFWSNKEDPNTCLDDILEGNIRMKIE